MMERNIGDRIRVVSYEDLPEDVKSAGIAKVCDKEGEIIDRLYSEAKGEYVYSVLIDGKKIPSRIAFTEDMFAEETDSFSADVTIDDNLVIIRLYNNGEEIRHAHAHVFNDGAAGIAQAVSFAAKRLCFSFGENKEKYGGDDR